MRARAVALLLLLAAPAAWGESDDPLVCPPPIDDDASTRVARAKEHYDRGTTLYDQGDYERAIPEYRAAFCILPDPDPVHSIATSYEKLLDYEHAVIWFKAYLQVYPDTPDNAGKRATIENRLRVLRSLPARLRVATEPPGAKITLEGMSTGPVTALANAKDAITVAAGTYTMRIAMPGYEPVTETITAQIGQPYSYVYRLVPLTGSLQVSVSPSDARILIDDKVAGVGSYGDRLPIGRHKLTLEAEGRPPERRDLSVDPESPTTIHITMRPAKPPDGKVELVIGSTAMGFVEGAILGTGLFNDSPGLITTSIALGGAFGFVGPYFILPHELPVGTTSVMIGGRLWGALEGGALAATLYDGDIGGHQEVASILTVSGSLAFGLGSYYVAQKTQMTAGDAALFNSGGMWGAATGALVWVAFGQDDRLGGPLLLAGLNLGLLTGGVLGSQTEFSRGHVALIDASGIAGLITGTSLAAIVKQGDNEGMARFALGGMAIGLIAGTILTSNVDGETTIGPATGVAMDPRGKPVATFGLGGRF